MFPAVCLMSFGSPALSSSSSSSSFSFGPLLLSPNSSCSCLSVSSLWRRKCFIFLLVEAAAVFSGDHEPRRLSLQWVGRGSGCSRQPRPPGRAVLPALLPRAPAVPCGQNERLSFWFSESSSCPPLCPHLSSRIRLTLSALSFLSCSSSARCSAVSFCTRSAIAS